MQDDPVAVARLFRYPRIGNSVTIASELFGDIREILGDQEPLSDRESRLTSLRDVSQAVSRGAAALTVVLVGLIGTVLSRTQK